jgi:uncharacterized membrane protein YeaQ/YmgE (transglycosylase-associated protein family)
MNMEQILINLITGALGGVGAGKASPNFDLGTIGNIISGLVGGGLLGQIVTLALPSVVVAVTAVTSSSFRLRQTVNVKVVSPQPSLLTTSTVNCPA